MPLRGFVSFSQAQLHLDEPADRHVLFLQSLVTTGLESSSAASLRNFLIGRYAFTCFLDQFRQSSNFMASDAPPPIVKTVRYD